MAKKRKSQTTMLDHSAAKVELLGKYLENYLNVLINVDFFSTLQFYDLFCGEGLYPDGKKGSPLIILDEIRKILLKKGAKNIDCYFNDSDTTKIHKLDQVITTKNSDLRGQVQIETSSQDYTNILAKVITKTKTPKSKTFVFIDPYGYKNISINQIKSLLDSRKSEVLIWLPLNHIFRAKYNSKEDAVSNFVEQLISREELEELSHNRINSWTFSEILKDAFQRGVGKEYYVDNFRIKKDKSTLYCMYFFTSHIKGLEKMLAAKWAIDADHGKGWHHEDTLVQMDLFSQSKDKGDTFWADNWRTKLKDFLACNTRTNGELYEFTIRGGFLPKHTNQILKTWQDNGKISVYLSNGDNARKGSFYNTFRYYRDDSSKVKFKLS